MKFRMMLALGACLALAACGDDEESEETPDTGMEPDSGMETDSGTEDSGMETDSTTEEDTGATEDVVEDTTISPPTCEEGVGVLSMAGGMVDQDGVPVGGAKAQLCLRTAPGGNLLCLRPADTAEDGSFEIFVPSNAQCLEEATVRALLPNTTFATTYCEVPLDNVSDDFVLSAVEDFRLFDTEAPTTLPELGDETQVRTIVFADGLEVDIAPSIMQNSNQYYDILQSARVDPASEGLCFLEDGEAPTALWAFTPEMNVDGVGDVRIPNEDGLAPGTTVEIYVLGGLGTTVGREEIKEAEWRMVGTGTVSEDGTFIDAPETMHVFNWLGYRVTE